MTLTEIRSVRTEDLPDLAVIAEETGLFPAGMMPDLAAPVLAGEGGVVLLVGLRELRPVSLCYAVQETLADGVWNMLALCVTPQSQRSGLGTRLVRYLEEDLRSRSQRMIIVDTSDTKSFEAARAFYETSGYEREARIRDYWAEGDDKLTFRKVLSSR